MKTSKHRPSGYRTFPEKILLQATTNPEHTPLPPVRIFIGTEAAQLRAERILVWSIEAVRNPARAYEIYLMKELEGFDRRRWLTGFTNYRFAIPDFAGGKGRAIYNDVDQVYLTDPAELFETDLHHHGFLTIAQNDSSVMLMDCEKMQGLWNRERAQIERKTTLLKDALAIEGLWGKLAPEWNARDEEYQEGRSKVLHYTALHTQPWNPFPEEFVYQESPVGDVWHRLYHQANQAKYHVFSRQQPSSQFQKVAKYLNDRHVSHESSLDRTPGAPLAASISEFITAYRPNGLLHHHIGPDPSSTAILDSIKSAHPTLPITTIEALFAEHMEKAPHQDLVYASGGLSHLPDEDVGWMLQEIFSLSTEAIFIEIREEPFSKDALPLLSQRKRDAQWWLTQIKAIGAQNPHIQWTLLFHGQKTEDPQSMFIRKGGKWLGPPPNIWILSDGKVGHTTQCETLAQTLGWPYVIKQVAFNKLNTHQKKIWTILPPNLYGMNQDASDPLTPPWPDVVMAAGWRTAPIARWIARESSGHSRSIQIGRNGGICAELFDIVVTPSYYQFLPHPNRIETLAPLNSPNTTPSSTVQEQWPNLFNNTPHPRIILVIGGSTKRFSLTAKQAREIGKQIVDLAQECRGTIFAVTSPRTSHEVTQAIEDALSPPHSVHRWTPNQTANPYYAYLLGGDIIVVTGESESMLAEAASLGKPVYIIPIPERQANWVTSLNEWIVQRAHSRPLNKRGTVRPQQGIEKICSRLLQLGLVQPRRSLTQFHQSLIQQGIALPFGEPLRNGTRPQLREGEKVAEKIQDILGVFVESPSNPHQTSTLSQ